jgi:hypothetical protein
MQRYVDDFQLADQHGQINKKVVVNLDVQVAKNKFIKFITPSIEN